MKKYIFAVGSITYAIKGRNILRREGLKAFVERTPADSRREGCGYSIYIYNDAPKAAALLEKNGIKILTQSEESS